MPSLGKVPTNENFSVGALQKMFVFSENFGSDSILFLTILSHETVHGYRC
jgi:hypothetical protein